jgi:hypothetical protein
MFSPSSFFHPPPLLTLPCPLPSPSPYPCSLHSLTVLYKSLLYSPLRLDHSIPKVKEFCGQNLSLIRSCHLTHLARLSDDIRGREGGRAGEKGEIILQMSFTVQPHHHQRGRYRQRIITKSDQHQIYEERESERQREVKGER